MPNRSRSDGGAAGRWDNHRRRLRARGPADVPIVRPDAVAFGASEEHATSVPLMDGRIAAGQPLVVDDLKISDYISFLKQLIQQLGVTKPRCVRVGRRERSMFPTIYPDAIVLLDCSDSKRERPRERWHLRGQPRVRFNAQGGHRRRRRRVPQLGQRGQDRIPHDRDPARGPRRRLGSAQDHRRRGGSQHQHARVTSPVTAAGTHRCMQFSAESQRRAGVRVLRPWLASARLVRLFVPIGQLSQVRPGVLDTIELFVDRAHCRRFAIPRDAWKSARGRWA